MEKGLYAGIEAEHDACGVGMVVNVGGVKSHALVEQALDILQSMEHRGAEGADSQSGDGAGITLQIPHEFILLQGIAVPEKGRYAAGVVFMPAGQAEVQRQLLDLIGQEARQQGLRLIAVRRVPVRSEVLGPTARAAEPVVMQIFLSQPHDVLFSQVFAPEELERRLYRVRRRTEIKAQEIHGASDFYICSLSSRTLVYKGMLTSRQLRQYYPDLEHPCFTSAIAVVHSRFSTNTFPSWRLAQPFRLVAHNGEINTIRSNRAWMKARQSVLHGGLLGDISDLTPLLQPEMSDSASFDNALEFMTLSGMELPKALSVMVPESFNDLNPLPEAVKAFYEYHSILMEPWDGPAALLFTDGRYAGGMLDRNGLRPARYVLTHSGMIVVASEAGVLPIPDAEIAQKGRLRPGKILLVDTQEARVINDAAIKASLAAQHPYREWLRDNRIQLENLHSGRHPSAKVGQLEARLRLWNYSAEDVRCTILPMAVTASEPTAAMGNDTAIPPLNQGPQLLMNYFRQQFAQVTNPPIDSIRERLVMSLTEYIGRVGTGILDPSPENCKMVRLPHPILTNTALDLLCHISYKGFKTIKLDALYPAHEEAKGLQNAVEELCKQASECVDKGYNYIILTDRQVSAEMAPIPSLLAVSAVHHRLIQEGKRVQTALIAESGEVREPMQAALLLGYGASALCPYMAYAIIDDQVAKGHLQMDYPSAEANYIEAMKKALLKIMAKMGISTIRSYRGAKHFEAFGLDQELLKTYFGTQTTTIGGTGIHKIASDTSALHALAYAAQDDQDDVQKKGGADGLPDIGLFSWRKGGLRHAWSPKVISTLQKAIADEDYEKYLEFSALASNAEQPLFLRDLWSLRFASKPLPLDQVEPEEAIIRRMVGAGMSFGALSQEAHEAIAIACNMMGTRSNSGEGGEDASRFHTTANGVSLSSKVKQIASGRFGVTTEYLVNATELQIKVAQGAKPGEGGQLPGFKVNEIIARTRHSVPGITLISPPPHHDIYSIEDLAQLIYDLKHVNPRACVSVKLVASSGVGTIAAGVAKAKADVITISGAEGGTGASPASSMRFAGVCTEIGIAEAQQTLVRNGLRQFVRLQTDGQLKSGRDIVMLAALGADEFAFGTSLLIALGCVMLRKCNKNSCPMGVATQDPELRKRFRGKPENIVRYFHFMAREVRELLSKMGLRNLDELIGHTEYIKPQSVGGLDFSRLLHQSGAGSPVPTPLHYIHDREPVAIGALHQRLYADILGSDMLGATASGIGAPSALGTLTYPIANTDRSVGAGLSGEITRRFGPLGLPPQKALTLTFQGSAGQSFGAFLVPGLTFRLQGEANDYFAKGLSGGTVAIFPNPAATFKPSQNTIAGNTGLYGATSGALFVNGQVGERLAVRNSGAIAVVEGAGDHCCEYMTDGRVVVLGPVGRNFAAGMSGGIAYVWDPDHTFDYFCNMDLVEISLVETPRALAELHTLLERHLQATASPLGAQILSDWPASASTFLEVIPTAYRPLLPEN